LLADLILPGTHGSAASFDLSDKNLLIPDTTACCYLGITQELNIECQLRIGVRFLDVRIAGDYCGKSDVNKKRNEIRKKNMLGKLKRKAYNKSPQPVVTDKTGEDEGDKIMTKLESIEPKEKKKINEEFGRMKELLSYNRKTQ
jgi:hypothetical protein